MAEIKSFVVTYWSTITEWALMVIAYFLVFLFRGKMSGTAQNLNLAFTQLKTVFNENTLKAKSQLEESKAKYAEAVGKIEHLERRLAAVDRAICVLLDADKTEESEETEDDSQHS